ncbi:MAG: hypothetical protein FJY85_00170 [Deltaproteobacteria bacterium]|nr:hypothetical protein [Deltaproteobacteria bacterium]
MNNVKILPVFTRFSWQWLLVCFCFLVILHLVPTYFSIGLLGLLYARSPVVLAIWLALGAALVAGFVGYRSRGLTIIEPTLATLLYALMIVMMYGPLIGSYVFSLHPASEARMSLLLLASVSALSGSVIGELLRIRKERRLKLAGVGSGSKFGS